MYSLVVICSYVLSCCKRQRSRARTNSAREAAEAAAEAAVVMDETGEAILPEDLFTQSTRLTDVELDDARMAVLG